MKIQNYINSSPLFATLSASQRVVRIFRKEFDDLNHLQAIVLVALYFDRGKIITPSQLVEALQVSPASISQAITALQKKKLVRRETVLSDARKFSLLVTALGVQRVQRLIKAFDVVQRKLEVHLGQNKTRQIAEDIGELCRFLGQT